MCITVALTIVQNSGAFPVYEETVNTPGDYQALVYNATGMNPNGTVAVQPQLGSVHTDWATVFMQGMSLSTLWTVLGVIGQLLIIIPMLLYFGLPIYAAIGVQVVCWFSYLYTLITFIRGTPA